MSIIDSIKRLFSGGERSAEQPAPRADYAAEPRPTPEPPPAPPPAPSLTAEPPVTVDESPLTEPAAGTLPLEGDEPGQQETALP